MKYLMKNRLFKIIVLFTIISFILGIIFYSIIGNNSKDIINNNINLLIDNKLIKYKDIFINNIITTSIIYILGISIVGIILILPIYLFKVFILSFEFISLVVNLSLKNFVIIFLYLIPNIINLIIYFIICYYSINYSIFLIKNIFFNKKYNMFQITKKYFFIYLISLILIIISSLIELFVLPRLSYFKI